MDPYWTANLGTERGGRARNTLLMLAGRGQMLVILAVLIPVLLGVVAMAVDISTFDWTWSRMQAAADAAALAGCSNLPTSRSRAIATATAYAVTDGMLAS